MGTYKKRWITLGIAAIIGAGYALYANKRLFLVHDITTGESADYPHLRSRVYYAEPGAVLAAAQQAIRTLPRMHTVFVDSENDAIEAEAETQVGRFIDDITIYAISLGHGQTRATIRSRSRLSGGDLGQNAVHITELQQAMDDRLTGNAAF